VTSVNVIAFENGVGNSRDLSLIAHALRKAGCDVSVTQVSVHARRRRRSAIIRTIVAAQRWRDRRRAAGPPRFDLNVMMEHVWPEELRSARRNIVVPNPEWFDRADQRLLRQVDCAWGKTAYALEALSRLGCAAEFVGFDSEDRHDPAVARAPSFFHLAGKSRMKGTTRLVRLWSLHPEWPELTVVHSRKAAFEAVAADNIRYETRFLTDAELKTLQNRHQFHLCTSETEGWGHYIAEALSVGAVVIATDAPPMNEIVSSARGLLVRSAAAGNQHLATTYEFDRASLEGAIERALGMNAEQRAELGARAREWFCENKSGFAARIRRALGHL
jgi:glycosyltransferase involved in cell wall biosynthesis